jgi:hypothetical protein
MQASGIRAVEGRCLQRPWPFATPFEDDHEDENEPQRCAMSNRGLRAFPKSHLYLPRLESMFPRSGGPLCSLARHRLESANQLCAFLEMEACQLDSKSQKLFKTASPRKRSRLWAFIALCALSVCGIVWFLTDALCSVLIEAPTEALRPVGWLLRSEAASRTTPKEFLPAHGAVGVTPSHPKIPEPVPTPNTK